MENLVQTVQAVIIMDSKVVKYIKIVFLAILPVVLYFILYLMSDWLISISDGFEKCIIYEKFGILCPGCGNTRCVKALLKGHFIKAFGYNITIPLLICYFLFYYYCFVLKKAGVKIVQIVSRQRVAVALIILLVLYYFLRNII